MSPPRPPSRLPPWAPLLVIAAAWLAQGPVLRNGWIWDDAAVVRDGEEVRRGLAGVPDLVTRNWYGAAEDVGLYRPLVGATLALEAQVHGTEDAFGFHLTNLFLHGLCAVALLALLHRLLPGRGVVAASAAVLFAVHPLHTGTVSWIVARGDLLAALFSLLAALVWVSAKPMTPARALLAALCVLLALAGKEMAAPLPLALLVLDLARSGEGRWRAVAGRAWAYLVLLLPVVAWWALRRQASPYLGSAPGMAALEDRDLGERLVVGLFSLARTAWNLAVPAGISADRSDDPLFEPGAAIPAAYVWVAAAVVLSLVVALARMATRRAGPPAVAWALFALLSATVVQVVPLGVLHEDRFAYLPSLALVVVGGVALEALLSTRARAVAFAAAGAAAVALLATSWRVAADWRDERSYENALLSRNPQHRSALLRLGRWHLDEGRDRLAASAARPAPADPRAPRPERDAGQRHLAEAVRLLERAASIPSRRQGSPIWKALGDARLEMRDHVRAATAYETAITKKRVRLDGVSVPYQQVTGADLARGAVAPADARFLGAAWHRWGVALAAGGESEEAAKKFRQAALWLPDDGEVQHRAGTATLEQQDPVGALPFLERAARTLPDGARREKVRIVVEEVRGQLRSQASELLQLAARALGRPNGQREALAAYEDALQLQPNLVEALLGAAALEAEFKGNTRRAQERLRAARAALDEEARIPGSAADLGPLRERLEALEAKVEALREEAEREEAED